MKKAFLTFLIGGLHAPLFASEAVIDYTALIQGCSNHLYVIEGFMCILVGLSLWNAFKGGM